MDNMTIKSSFNEKGNYVGNYNRNHRKMILDTHQDDVHYEKLILNVTGIDELKKMNSSGSYEELNIYKDFEFVSPIDIVLMVENSCFVPANKNWTFTWDNYFICLYTEEKKLSDMRNNMRNPLYNLSKFTRNGGIKKHVWNPEKMIQKELYRKEKNILIY